MPDTIRDGTGTSNHVRVDTRNRLSIEGVTRSPNLDSTLLGEAFNINTGNVTISAETSLLYIKNTDNDQDLVIESIALGVGSAASQSNSGELYAVSDPTAGTVISSAVDVDMNANRNLGSANALSGQFYKGASGETLTGGTDIALFYHGTGRLFAGFEFVVPPNKAFGLRYDPSLSSGSAKVYAAVICHLRDTAETS